MKLNLPRTLTCVAVLWCLTAGRACAAANSYELVVKAGKHDRVNTPVTVLLVEAEQQANLKPVVLRRAALVKVTDADGNRLPAQLTMPGLLHEAEVRNGVVVRELHFIVPKLKRGESMKLTAVVSQEKPKGGGFAWKKEEGEFAELSYAGRPVLRYVCKTLTDQTREDAFKVYHHLYDPAGTRFVTKGPGGLYTHHRGIFFGYCGITYGKGQKADTWSGRNTPETHGGFLAEEAGPVLGRHLVAVDWQGSDGKPYLKEQRELTVYHVPGGHLVEFASRLSTTGGKVKLDGNAPHAGFQFRAAEEVAAKTQKQTYYLRRDGKGELGQARAKAMDLPWDAISFVLGEKRYTTLYLDKPTNPKPAEYNERTYGRFGSFFRYELDEGKDLLVNYRLWLQDGEMTVEQAAALHADFVEPVEVGGR